MLAFKSHTLEDHTDSLANYLPGGQLFEAKFLPEKNLRKYLRGMASELQRFYEILQEVAEEHDITKTQALINEWETALGIPGTCFNNNDSLVIRRRNLLLKLSGLHGSTEQDFIQLAAKLGYVVTVEPAKVHGMFPAQFPISFYDSGKAVIFTVIITLPPDDEPQGFTFGFPFKFTHPDNALLECLFNRIRPANVRVLFRYYSPNTPPVDNPHPDGFRLQDDFNGFLLLQDGSSALRLEN